MPVLRPHQTKLLEQLTQDPARRRALIVAPPGMGITTVLVDIAVRSVSQGETVLIVTANRTLAEQWLRVLGGAGVENLTNLRTAESAILAMDKPDGPAWGELPGALISTIQVLSRGPGRRLAADLSPSLLIVDGVPPSARTDGPWRHTLSELIAHSARAIVTSESIGQWPELDAFEVFQITLADALEANTVLTLAIAKYRTPPDEREVLNDAVTVIQQLTGPLSKASTRPAIHGTLLRLASRSANESPDQDAIESLAGVAPATSTPAGTVEVVWSILDRIEQLGEDLRLRRLTQVVGEASLLGPVIVVTDRVDELEYVASHLRAIAEVDTVSGSTTNDDRERTLELRTGRVVVATSATLRGFELQAGTRQVWWTTPRSLLEATLRLSRVRGGGICIALMSEPPMPADDRLLDIITQLRDEFGADSLQIDQLASFD